MVRAAGPSVAANRADYDIAVRTDLKGQGIGARLMRETLREAGRRGFAAVGGDVSPDDRTMLLLAGDLGFRRVALEGGTVRIEAVPQAETELVAVPPPWYLSGTISDADPHGRAEVRRGG